MQGGRTGEVAVIFLSTRTGADAEGYAAAADAMERLAAEQPGYRGMESVRGTDGLGITVSFWVARSPRTHRHPRCRAGSLV
jgi:heme-degrading monooxygenase HmoA